MLALASSQHCLVALASIGEAGVDEVGGGAVREGAGAIAVVCVCVKGGGVGMRGESADVLLPLEVLSLLALLAKKYKH